MAAAGCCVLLAAGCSAGGSGAAGPITLGSVNTLSGPITFPEASRAAQAVFDDVNAAGGVHGRKIRYVPEDDKGDPTTAAQAARDLIDNDGVVALVGSASLVQCEVNAAFYQQQNIVDITGTGVDPKCFDSANIAPVNAGPFVSTTVVLDYAYTRLRRTRLCAFFTIVAGTGAGYRQAVAEFERLTGGTLLIEDLSLSEQTTDYTPYVLRAKQAGCQVVLINGSEPIVVSWIKQAQAQMVTGVTWAFLASAYTVQVGRALGPAGDGVIANSEFEPYTEAGSPATAEWRAVMDKHNVPLTSFAQGGYLAARHIVQVLEGVKGPITRQAVTKALRTMAPIPSPMTGTPFVVGPGARHNPNRASKMVTLRGGVWRLAYPDWIVLPPASS